MMRNLLLCALAAPAFGAIELTPDNFDKEVLQSGKAAFIKFLAPW
jgi:protein disulfide-isomerase A6